MLRRQGGYRKGVVVFRGQGADPDKIRCDGFRVGQGVGSHSTGGTGVPALLCAPSGLPLGYRDASVAAPERVPGLYLLLVRPQPVRRSRDPFGHPGGRPHPRVQGLHNGPGQGQIFRKGEPGHWLRPAAVPADHAYHSSERNDCLAAADHMGAAGAVRPGPVPGEAGHLDRGGDGPLSTTKAEAILRITAHNGFRREGPGGLAGLKGGPVAPSVGPTRLRPAGGSVVRGGRQDRHCAVLFERGLFSVAPVSWSGHS